MNYCPNCGTILKENEDTCPNCQTKIIIQEEETKEPPKKEPKKKNPPKKSSKPATKKRTTLPKEEIKIKEIPITIKKTEKHDSSDKDIKEYLTKNRDDIDKFYKKDKLFFNISSIAKMIIVALLFVITVFAIFQIAIDNSKKSSLNTEKTTKKVENADLFNSWESSNGGEFVFNKDSTFYWYKTIDSKDNYYSGTFTYKTGDEAIKEMGYTEDEFKSLFGENIQKENIYSIEITPTKTIIDKKDVTKQTIKNNTTWWYILIIDENGQAISYNKTLDIRYELKIKVD